MGGEGGDEGCKVASWKWTETGRARDNVRKRASGGGEERLANGDEGPARNGKGGGGGNKDLAREMEERQEM